MITNCVCLVPGILKLLSRERKESGSIFITFMDILAIGAQLSGLFLWAGFKYSNTISNAEIVTITMLPVALLLTSMGWWENYADSTSPFGNPMLTHLLTFFFFFFLCDVFLSW